MACSSTISRTIHLGLQRNSSPILGSQLEGIVNSLLPCSSAGHCHNWCTYVHQLRHAGHFNTIASANQRHQHAAHQQGVFHGEDILLACRSDLPWIKRVIAPVSHRPYIPFINRQIDPFLFMQSRNYCITQGNHSIDICIQLY